MADNALRKHQLAMLQMLKEFDAVCKKHDIKYMIFAGTALGAVRHKGFIPWDDDLDVIMVRDEYERFLKVAAGEFDKNTYYVQREFSSHWPMFFSKLRLNNTACIEKFHPKDEQIHQGVYIDIFPCDNLSDNALIRKMQFFASKIVISKALYKRGYETDSLAKKLIMQLCRILPNTPFVKLCMLKSNKKTKLVHSFLASSSKYSKSIYDRSWMTQTESIQFEDGKFPISANYDELLTRLYGDYMKIPPEEERLCKVHNEIVDLNRSYTEYLDAQREMKIETFSRSIR